MSELKDKCLAVLTNDLYFSYNNSELILNGINISVNTSHIYGLIGASGCGKTTLLKCILGRLKPSRGEVKVFGVKPLTPESGIPGADVGYMPQELGLYLEFTIEEIFFYFGRIFSMNKRVIKEKIKELSKLLKIPENNKPIRQFSGGQQKRISLCCALLHTPPLLILDEPTVGTDPSLSKIIFSHLRSLCMSGVTIILTTHYIEETRHADVVAFLRNGKILAEDNPKVLLNKYVSNRLEEVFLKLCDSENEEIDYQNNRFEVKTNALNYCYENKAFCDSNQTNSKLDRSKIQKKVNCEPSSTSKNRIQSSKFSYKFPALLQKNIKNLTYNWLLFAFFIILPSIQMLVLIYTVGDGPIDIKISVFNEEIIINRTDSWGQIFINCLNDKTFKKVSFNSFESAIDSVRRGQTYALIDISESFTNALRLRALYKSDVDEEILDESLIRVYIDWSNQMVALQIEHYIYEALNKFIVKVANYSNINPESIRIPIVYEEPVYSVRSESMKDFVLPGVLVLFAFFATAGVTGNLVIMDQKDGILERSLVAGVNAIDFLLSYILTQFLILCLQTLFLISISVILFTKVMTESFILVLALILSQGLCGTAYGLLLSSLINDMLYLAIVGIFIFLVCLVMGGIFWPIENMPLIIQYLSQFFPTTLANHSMRSILYRKWSFSHYEVYMGFVVTYVWLSVFLILTLILFKKKFN